MWRFWTRRAFDWFSRDLLLKSRRKAKEKVIWMPSNIIKWLLVVTACLIGWTQASEFPERECCDPVYPPPIPTVPSSSVATPTGRSGEKQIHKQSANVLIYISCTVLSPLWTKQNNRDTLSRKNFFYLLNYPGVLLLLNVTRNCIQSFIEIEIDTIMKNFNWTL